MWLVKLHKPSGAQARLLCLCSLAETACWLRGDNKSLDSQCATTAGRWLLLARYPTPAHTAWLATTQRQQAGQQHSCLGG